MTNARDLERELNQRAYGARTGPTAAKPTVYQLIGDDGTVSTAACERLAKAKTLAVTIADAFEALLLELMLVDHPEYKKDRESLPARFSAYKAAYVGTHAVENVGVWVHYSNGSLVHLLRPEDHYRLRTSRNIGLLTSEEQDAMKRTRVAVGGLSVGGLCATTLAMEGVKQFYLTDFDTLACSNLNRIGSSVSQLGTFKASIVSQKIWDIDPFADVVTSDKGYVGGDADEMFAGPHLPHVAIDAMDSFDAKVAIRQACRQRRVPLVWMIDMGDGVVQIGTERYDQDPGYPAFHGHLQKLQQRVGRPLSYVEACFAIFSHDHLPSRMTRSFRLACNSEWPGIPQLAGTVCIAAGAVARVVRRIVLGQPVVPEFFIEIDEKADPDYVTTRQVDRDATHSMLAELGLR